jgi:hypothetical protein
MRNTMRKLILLTITVVLAISAAGIAEETPEEVTWCEAPEEEAPETREVECWGSLAECEILAEEFYWAECMADAWIWAGAICAQEYAGVCIHECLSSMIFTDCMYYGTCGELLTACMDTTCPGGSWGYDHFIFTCMNHYVGYASLECLTAKEIYLTECECDE